MPLGCLGCRELHAAPLTALLRRPKCRYMLGYAIVLGGLGMGRKPDERPIRLDSPVTDLQMDYSLNRLTAAGNELSRLTERRLSSAVERPLPDLHNAGGYTRVGIDAAHKLRLWRGPYLPVAPETGSPTPAL